MDNVPTLVLTTEETRSTKRNGAFPLSVMRRLPAATSEATFAEMLNGVLDAASTSSSETESQEERWMAQSLQSGEVVQISDAGRFPEIEREETWVLGPTGVHVGTQVRYIYPWMKEGEAKAGEDRSTPNPSNACPLIHAYSIAELLGANSSSSN